MAFWLANAGHDVRVISAPPYYPQWKIYNNYSSLRFQKEFYKTNQSEGAGSVTVYRCPIWIPKKLSGVKRVMHLASFSITSAPTIIMQIFWRPNIMVVIEPPLFCAPLTLLISILSGARSWIHVQDFEVDAAFGLGILKMNFLQKIVLFFESFLLRSFDRVSTISDSMYKKLLTKGVPPQKARLFPNWIDIDSIYPMQHNTNPYREKFNINNETCVVLYSGNMGEKQGLLSVIEAAKIIERNKNILFVLCGEGSSRINLMAQAKDLTNIRWLPLQPLDKLNDLLNFADIHLLPQKNGLGDLMMPSKLLGMLASGRSIVAMAEKNTEVEEAVLKCGKVVKPGDSMACALAIEYLEKNPLVRQKMGWEARKLSFQRSMNPILSEFERNLFQLNN